MNSDMNSISSITNSDEGANSGHSDKQTEVKIKSLEHGTPILNVSDARGNNEGLTAYGEVDTRLISSSSVSQPNSLSLPITKNEDISVDLDHNRKRSRPDSWVGSNTTLIKRARVEEVIILDSSDDSDCESLSNGEKLKQSNNDSSYSREKEGGSHCDDDDDDDDSVVRDPKDASTTSSNVKQVGDSIATKNPSTPMDIINLADSDDEDDIANKQINQDLERNQCIDLTANDSDEDEEDYCCNQKITERVLDRKSKLGLDIFLLDDSDSEEESDGSRKSSCNVIVDSSSKITCDVENSSVPVMAKSLSEFTHHLENVSNYKDTLPDDTSTNLPYLQDQNAACNPMTTTENTFATSTCIRPLDADEDSGFENLNSAMLQNNDTFLNHTKTNSDNGISQSTEQLKSISVSASEKQKVSENQADDKLSRYESKSGAKREQFDLGSKPDKMLHLANYLENRDVGSKEFINTSRHIRKIVPPKKTTSSTASLPRLKSWQQNLSIHQIHQMKNNTRKENVFELRCHQDARSLLESRASSENPMILPIEAKDQARCTSFFYYIIRSYYFDVKRKQKAICIYCKSFSTMSHLHNPHLLGNHTLFCSKVPHDEKEALKILEGAQKSERNLSPIRFNHKEVINSILYRIGARKNDENETSDHGSECNKTSKSASLASSKDSLHVKDKRKSRNHQIEPELHRHRRSRSIPKYSSGDDDSFSLSSTATDPFADFDSYDQMIHQSYKSYTSKSGLPSRWITVQNYSRALLFDFKITTGPSSIPNAGNGAFIELVRVRKALETDEKSNIFETVSITQLALSAKIDDNDVIVRVGPSSIHDFDNAPEGKEDVIPFCSCDEGNGSIYLGKYGPFFEDDIKTDFFYDMKNLIFDSEPSVWSYGLSKGPNKIDEKDILKEDDDMFVLDITSDTTGMVHSEARRHIPMYVNEVGNNPALRPNVTPRDEIIDGEVGVSYYFFTDRPIYPGEKHELLVDYQGTYEETRERKGYGKSGVGSDKDDESARVRRNMSTRLGVEVSIRCNSHTKVVGCLHDMKKMVNAVIQSTDTSLKRFEKSAFSPLSDFEISMWIARFRLHWISDLFFKSWPLLGEDLKKNLHRMKFIPCKSFVSLVKTNEKLLRAYKYELLEESIFLASKGQLLLHPIDRSLFCPIARDIVKTISENLTFQLRTHQLFGTGLVKEILKLALEAATEIRNIAKKSATETGQNKVCEILRRLGFEVDDEKSAHHTLTCRVRTIDSPPVFQRINKNGISARVRWIKKSEDKDFELDLEWYLLFQVVKVVHILATKCFSGIEKFGYTLANLCKTVGVSFEMARTVVNMVMTEPYGETFQLFGSIHDDIVIGSKHKKNVQRTVASKSTGKKGMNSFCYSDGLFSRYWRVDTVPIPF